MIKGIGCDITSNKRFFEKKDLLINKILSENEIIRYNSYTSDSAKVCFLGGRFAAKEAIFKATNKNVLMKDIDIINDEFGKPIVKMDIEGVIHLSISHENDFSIAYVIYEIG